MKRRLVVWLLIQRKSTLLLLLCMYMLERVFSEARVEFGEKVAARLKLSRDGTKVLWPQPSDDPEDPQNVRMTPKFCTLPTLKSFLVE